MKDIRVFKAVIAAGLIVISYRGAAAQTRHEWDQQERNKAHIHDNQRRAERASLAHERVAETVSGILRLDSVRSFPDIFDDLVVVGEVTNTSSATVTFTRVLFDFYNGGTLVGSDYTYTFNPQTVRLSASGLFTDAIPSGAGGFFKMYTGIPYAPVTHYEFSSDGETYGFTPARGSVSLQGPIALSPNVLGGTDVAGTIRNTTPNALTFFTQVALSGRKAGQMSDAMFAYVTGVAVPCDSVTTDTGIAPLGTASLDYFFLEPVDQISQAAITWEEIAISESSVTIDAVGSSRAVAVFSNCNWAAVSNVPWLSITSGHAGSADGTVIYSVAANTGPPRTGTLTVAGITLTVTQGGSAPLDTDADGLPDDWELAFGLNHASSTGDNGSNGDPDGDGVTNGQELQAGTHPRGTFVRYLAEGSTAFFDTRIALANPTSVPVTALVHLLRQGGAVPVRRSVRLNAWQQQTLYADEVDALGEALFSAIVEADGPLGVDRTMSWGASSYGSHAETAIASPSPTWYFAEGATGGLFNLYYLLQNPHPTRAATVRVQYLREGTGPLEKHYTVSPNSRHTIWVDAESFPGIPGNPLASANLGAVIEVVSGPPVIAERAMYLDTAGQILGAGHASSGITTPAPEWFLAEGATFDFFDLFLLIANPNAAPATVDVDYLLPDASVRSKTYLVPAHERRTIWVDAEEFPNGSGNKALSETAVSARVRARDDLAIIVERAMWWPGPSATTWAEAHASAGSTTTGSRWVLADGEVGGRSDTETFILVANTSESVAQVRVTLLFEAGTPVARSFNVAANSRFTVAVRSEFPEALNRRFGALVESIGPDGVPIVVERAMYTSAGGVRFAAGTNVLGAHLQ